MFFRKKTQPPETPAFTVNSNLAATAAPLVVASPEAKPEERSYHAVEVNNFNRDFLADAIRTNEDIRRNGERLRRLSREMAKNGGDYRKFLKMCERNSDSGENLFCERQCRRTGVPVCGKPLE